jgi:hypothetical protein
MVGSYDSFYVPSRHPPVPAWHAPTSSQRASERGTARPPSTNPLRRTQDFSRSTIIFLVHFYGGGLICKRLVYVECMSTVT